jgi:hypothetical protein
MSEETNYRLACWRHGFIGRTEVHPLRQVQALIRARGAEANAVERWLVLGNIRAEMAEEFPDSADNWA